MPETRQYGAISVPFPAKYHMRHRNFELGVLLAGTVRPVRIDMCGERVESWPEARQRPG